MTKSRSTVGRIRGSRGSRTWCCGRLRTGLRADCLEAVAGELGLERRRTWVWGDEVMGLGVEDDSHRGCRAGRLWWARAAGLLPPVT